ncbi:MAG: hypothetical protein ACRC6X_02490 [Culicoidibacterales bacterium]
MRRRRLWQYMPLLLALFLLNGTTMMLLSQLGEQSFYLEHGESVTNGQNIASFQVSNSGVLLESIVQHREQLPQVPFAVEYYQNVPQNPLIPIYVIWQQPDMKFTVPLRRVLQPQQLESGVIVGKKVWDNLLEVNKKQVIINNTPFTITAIAGEKGVSTGYFDEAVVLSGESITTDYLSRLPQNYTGILYVYTEQKNHLELFASILDLKYPAEQSTGFSFMGTAEQGKNHREAIYRGGVKRLLPVYIIVLITVLVLVLFLIEQQGYRWIVFKAMGATNGGVMLHIVKIGAAIFTLSVAVPLMLQQVSVSLDLIFFEQIRVTAIVLLQAQTLVFVSLYALLTTRGVYKHQPAQFLQAKK